MKLPNFTAKPPPFRKYARVSARTNSSARAPACLNKTHEPVLCGPLETFVTCYERKTAGVAIPVGKPTGKKVAIVGAGPAGLGCAEQLFQQGHSVTFFDSKPAPGGLLVYGIPNFKLAKEVFFCRWGDFEKAGAKFVGNTYYR